MRPAVSQSYNEPEIYRSSDFPPGLGRESTSAFRHVDSVLSSSIDSFSHWLHNTDEKCLLGICEVNPKLPRLGSRQVIAILKRDGWYEHHQRGSHLAMRHPEKQGQVTIPIHAGKDIHPTTLKFILRQADLTADDFLKLLKGR